MSPALAIAVLLNNYIHDVATGLLIISALWIGWIARDLGDAPGKECIAIFKRGYSRSVRFTMNSIVVIILTGMVRTFFFMRFEWDIALGKGLVPILLIKHVLIFALLGAGFYAWVGVKTRLANLPGWEDKKNA